MIEIKYFYEESAFILFLGAILGKMLLLRGRRENRMGTEGMKSLNNEYILTVEASNMFP